jgi:hypothetical protein
VKLGQERPRHLELSDPAISAAAVSRERGWFCSIGESGLRRTALVVSLQSADVWKLENLTGDQGAERVDAQANAVLIHCLLGHLDSKFSEFTNNPGQTPIGIGL